MVYLAVYGPTEGARARVGPDVRALAGATLAAAPGALPQPIHLVWRVGRDRLIELLAALRTHGANHVVLNLKYGRRPADEVLEEIAEFVLPEFAPLVADARPTVQRAREAATADSN